MEKAIKLSHLDRGYVNPNPIVGSVIVKNNIIVGEGYHKVYGGSHSEVMAIENAGKEAKGSTLYVTLEPCCHYGQPPTPSTDKIIKSGIKRVVIGFRP